MDTVTVCITKYNRNNVSYIFRNNCKHICHYDDNGFHFRKHNKEKPSLRPQTVIDWVQHPNPRALHEIHKAVFTILTTYFALIKLSRGVKK